VGNVRAVFDTNVMVSALLSERSTPAQAFFATLQQGEVLVSAPLVNEINRILRRKKFDRYLTAEQRETFLIALVQSTTLVEINATIHICRDPKDNMLLELAVSGKADVIITGDSDLLVLHPFRNIAILKPEAFLKTYFSTNS
jgi:putative PIN family toxin of toxin-antitoxin system